MVVIKTRSLDVCGQARKRMPIAFEGKKRNVMGLSVNIEFKPVTRYLP